MRTNAITARAIALLLALGLFFGSAGAGRARAEPPPQEPHNPSATASLRAGASPLSGSARPSQTPPPEPGLRILRSDESGIVLELGTPDFQIEPLVTEEIACDRLSAADYATSDQAGWPELPVRGAMLGIPPQADVTLTVLEVDAGTLPGAYDLCPVPGPIVEMTPDGKVQYRGATRARDARAYAADAFWPTTPAEIVATGFIRSQRVVQVRFHPFQYNPVSGQLRHLRRILVRLDFGSRPLLAAATAAPVDEGLFEETLGHILLNYEQAQGWRSSPSMSARSNDFGRSKPGNAQTPTTEVVTTNAYKVFVNETGLYQITYADLVAAGADLSGVDPRNLHLRNRGQEVAIQVEGEGDGSFDPGDAILFYGEQINTTYTRTNVYWLTWDDFQGVRMADVDGTPTGGGAPPAYFLTTQHLEKDTAYDSSRSSGNDDHWYWNYIYKGVYNSQVYTTVLHNVASVPLTATVRGLFRSYEAVPYHSIQISLNNHPIYTDTWAPGGEYTFTVDVPQTYINEGTNAITVTGGVSVTGPITTDIFYVNWFEMDYYATYAAFDDTAFFSGDQPGPYRVSGFTTDTVALFDVTAPAQPARIVGGVLQLEGSTYTLSFRQSATGRNYFALTSARRKSPARIERDAPSNLRDARNGADYIVITHGDFYTTVLPLAEYRRAQGLRSVVVDVQDVYDEFSAGLFDPTAIRDFLAYAYANWQPPAPAYVLLVGDGNYDFKNNLGRGEPNYIPPYLADVDPWIGEAAADNRYVCVSGDDVLPDMHIGRLPVKTRAEAAAMVAKILGYEQNPPDGDWNRRVLFVADNPDDAGNFHALSDALIAGYLPVPYTADKVYYGQTHTAIPAARAAITNAINQGRLVVNYMGHGATAVWASEQLLRIGDIGTLTNTTRLPFMVPMTCLEGNFIYPSSPAWDRSSLGESIVRAQGKGAIASWSPAGFGVVAGHDYLNKGLFQALFFDGVAHIGPATTQGKLYLYSHSGGYRDLLDTYVLFGDPALALAVLRADLSIAKTVDAPDSLHPGDAITYTLAYSNAGPASAFHVVITDTLPAALLAPTVASAGAAITPRPGSRFVWDVADLAPGEGGVITITGLVSPTFTGVLSNTAAIAATVVESNVANNTAGPVWTAVAIADVADVALEKRGPAAVPAGSLITYTLIYSNAGSAPATRVVITDALPAALLAPTIASAGAAITPRAGTRFVWDVADLAPGEGGVITITATLPHTIGGTLTNTASIATVAQETSVANNTATTNTQILHRVYLPLLRKR